jgi:hypothetical protein
VTFGWLLGNTPDSARWSGQNFRSATRKSIEKALPSFVRNTVPSALSDRTAVSFKGSLFDGAAGSIAPREQSIAGRDVELKDWVMRALAGDRNVTQSGNSVGKALGATSRCGLSARVVRSDLGRAVA